MLAGSGTGVLGGVIWSTVLLISEIDAVPAVELVAELASFCTSTIDTGVGNMVELENGPARLTLRFVTVPPLHRGSIPPSQIVSPTLPAAPVPVKAPTNERAALSIRG